MATDLIRYDVLVQQALRGVVKQVLQDGARDGLPGAHHFYISFDTSGAGVKISQRLKTMYPEEMTIVLQHQFWDLSVTDTLFEVSLSFDKIAERLVVPFEAITGFFDPSVKFGLKFEAADVTPENDDAAKPARPRGKSSRKPAAETTAEEPAAAPRKSGKTPAREAEPVTAEAGEKDAAADAPGTAEVVSLDAFRKKK